ncbi:MAG TPA: phosphoribosylglycinamide formyltransferase [Acidimicrobiales bacterium]|nr:phosphoribosylglycinamide formyltransferase [Acidimicrobiales bacterium]
MSEVRLGVLVSGSGTILEAMLAHGLKVTLVVADRACRALEVAERAKVDALLVNRADFGGFRADFDRVAYTEALTKELRAHGVTLLAMAGFGTILTSALHEAYPGRVLNTHPSLLPAFKGWHAVTQALESGVKETGCTVHVATLELDDGPILAQRRVAILSDDDEASLHERIKSVERELYPVVVDRVMAFMSRGLEPRDVVGTLEES